MFIKRERNIEIGQMFHVDLILKKKDIKPELLSKFE